jgi:hypothetical protein
VLTLPDKPVLEGGAAVLTLTLLALKGLYYRLYCQAIVELAARKPLHYGRGEVL